MGGGESFKRDRAPEYVAHLEAEIERSTSVKALREVVARANAAEARIAALEAEVEALKNHLMRCHPANAGCAFEADERHRQKKAALAARGR